MYTYPQGDLFSTIILSLLSLLTLAVFLGVVYAIVYAIFMFVFSGGDEKKITKAWNSIRYALVGFVLTSIILFAIPGALRAMKVPGYQYYTASNIFKTAKGWVNKIIGVFSKTQTPIQADGNYQL